MKKSITIIFMIALLFASCAKEKGMGITGIPYQETEKGQWGMISTDGEIIFSDEFKNQPTVIKEGMFMVKNNNNLWEIYKADKKPKKVGAEYKSATLFDNGRAIVCERNKHISIIDKDGKTLKLIDKVDGKEVDEARTFSGGYAVYKADGYYGVIDADAAPVIPAQYCYISNCSDGKFIAIDKKYEKEYKADSLSLVKYTILDTKGKKILELNGAKYYNIGQFQNSMLPVCVKKEGNKMWGIINEKEETIVKPTEKFTKIGEIDGESFTYYNGEGWGLMSLKGETLIRAKYDGLSFDCDNKLLAYTSEKDGKNSFKFIDKEDNQTGKDTYVKATPFYMLEGEHALVQVSDKQWSLINKDGEALEKMPDMVNVSFQTGDYIIESDYVDVGKMLDELKITQNGMEGVTFSSTPKDVVNLLAKYIWRSDEKNNGKSASLYEYVSTFDYSRDISNVSANIAIDFSGSMSKETYRTKRVIDYTYYDWYWYHDEKIPTGYVWNPVNITSFKIEFVHNGKMFGKLRMTFNELAKRFKAMGKVVKENDGAVVIKLNNKKTAFIYMKPKAVIATWGNMNAEDININGYKDAKEEMGNEKSSLEPDMDEEVDTVAVDPADYY